jgi:hypothetical protein
VMISSAPMTRRPQTRRGLAGFTARIGLAWAPP